jgi:hypothetical protein
MSILCEKPPLPPWHAKRCPEGECLECGVTTFKVCPRELQYDKLIEWKSVRYEVGKIDEGRNKKDQKLEYHLTLPRELLKYLYPCLKEFVLHNYVSRWQNLQFKEYVENLPLKIVFSCVDFFENYNIKIQNDVQSMHWHNFQVTILVLIRYRPSLILHDLINLDSSLIKEVHYFVLYDTSHDTLFVQHVFMLHWSHLQSQGCIPSNHIGWNDGCSCQFKSARAWYFLSRYPNLLDFTNHPRGCQLIWNFFATSHGKGEVDGARALLKCEVRKEQIKSNGRKFQNVAKVVAFLRSKTNEYHDAYPNVR